MLPQEVMRDAGRRRRFLKEARLAAAINHPNLVAIYDDGRTPIRLLPLPLHCPARAAFRAPTRSSITPDMLTWTYRSSVALLLLVTGCDSDGTCVSRDPKDPKDKGHCSVNMPKSQCEQQYGTKLGTEGKEFIAKTKSDGVKECKSRGFVEPITPGGEQDAEKGKLAGFKKPWKAD